MQKALYDRLHHLFPASVLYDGRPVLSMRRLHRKFCANQPAFSAKFYKIMGVFHKINQCYMKKECKIRSKLQYLCSKLDEDGMSNRIKNAPPKQRIF